MKKASVIKIVLALFIIWVFRLPMPYLSHASSNDNFGRQLKETRKSYHLTVEELSKITGLDKYYLEGVEDGKYNIGQIENKKLQEYFGNSLTAI
jgi:DNA-binding XRE family transcriptional regulator